MKQDSVDRDGRDYYAWIRRTVPFGYRIESIQESNARHSRVAMRLVPDPQQSAMIREVFERVAKGSSDT
jgi:hypothetical protein